MSQLKPLTPKRRARLLADYRSLVVPGDEAPHYHTKKFNVGWPAAKWPNGTPRRLSNETLYQHLVGRLVVGARWHLTDLVTCIVFDIDADRAKYNPRARATKALASVRERFDALCRAFARCELQAIRSSRSGGLHAYIFLDQPCSGVEARAVVIDRLHAAGIEVRPGVLEVWPANQVLRLPLGEGSHLLARDMTPICATVKAGRVYRNVPASINHLASFKRRHAVSLDSLRMNTAPAPRVDQFSSKKRSRSSPKAPIGKNGNEDTEVSFKDDIEASHDGISEYGARYRQASRRVYWLRVTRGLSAKQAMEEFERWLTTGSHSSKDLESDRAPAVIGRMLHDAARYIEQLNGQIAGGDLTPGTASRLAMSAMVKQLRHEHVKGWRDVARGALTMKDMAIVHHLPANVRPSIEVMLGLLRLAAVRIGSNRFEISMAALTLQTIAGGRTRPVLDPEGRRVRLLAVSAYKAVLRVLDRLGIVSLVAAAKVGERARVFDVTLPT